MTGECLQLSREAQENESVLNAKSASKEIAQHTTAAYEKNAKG